MLAETKNTGITFIVSSLLVTTFTGCSMEDIKRLAYRMTREYSCENHGPNMPKKQVECMEQGMSFDEYEKARRQEIGNDK